MGCLSQRNASAYTPELQAHPLSPHSVRLPKGHDFFFPSSPRRVVRAHGVLYRHAHLKHWKGPASPLIGDKTIFGASALHPCTGVDGASI